MIFVSTVFHSGETAVMVVANLLENGFSKIELSGGAYSGTLINELLEFKEKCCLQVHNYFPPPSKPFVFNLGSLDLDIAKASILHAQKAICLAVSLGRPVFSFHAGYLFDPKPTELGRRMSKRQLYDLEESTFRFIDRVNDLASFAAKEGASLLIENNVLSAENYVEFGCNPFLMTSLADTLSIMKNTDERVNLLVDVGHLKVSANTLGFDPVDFMDKCDSWINAYHLSDNDGLSDSNDLVRNDSWFWPYLKPGLDYYSLEIRCGLIILKQQLQLAKEYVDS